MRRVALLTIFFYCCTFAAPPQSRSAVPVALLAAAAVGATMASTTAGTYYAQTGQAPEYVKTASNAVASAADAVFQPSYLAQAVGLLFTPQSLNTAKDYYVGKAAAVGAKVSDLLDTVADSADSAYTSLKELIDSVTTHNTPSSSYALTGGDVIDTPVGILQLRSDSSGRWFTVLTKPWDYVSGYADYFGSYGGVSYSVHLIGGVYNICKVEPVSGTPGWYTVYRWPCTVVSIPVTNPLTPNDVVDYPTLAAGLGNPSSAVADDVRDAIKNTDHDKKIFADSTPSTSGATTTAPTISAAEIAQILKDNAAAVAQAAAEAAQAVAAANPTDAAAQIAALQASATAAQAAADAAQNSAEEPQEETFSPISDSPFGTAYNPGPFDIPTRFTTFLGNVKSSGLFSFSSAFFDSLPGGGSPVYTVNAGNYGTHTIDLSDTMSTGLAVLKSILLACFGFLSIRAVIMKR